MSDRKRSYKNVRAACVNCKQLRTIKCRGLCGWCSEKKEVRDRFPSTSKYARKGKLIDNESPPLDATPTHYPQGSKGKVELMAERVARGLSPMHPDDGTWDGPEVPGTSMELNSDHGGTKRLAPPERQQGTRASLAGGSQAGQRNGRVYRVHGVCRGRQEG